TLTLSPLSLSLSFKSYGAHRHLHSFPTRRSSDLLHLSRTPCKPGLPAREQHKAGRMELLVTSFEDFERRTRDQLARILSAGNLRSEEHTSELQSRGHLVCRLLLEKKKQ